MSDIMEQDNMEFTADDIIRAAVQVRINGLETIVNEIAEGVKAEQILGTNALPQLRAGFDEKEITSRLKAQMSVEEKKKRADIIINNNGTLQEMYDSIDECLKVILC